MRNVQDAPGTTEAGRAALKWLAEHGGDGVFAERNHSVLLAAGERAPFMRATWNELSRLGYIEFYGKRRARLVPGHGASELTIAADRVNRPVSLS